MGIATLLLKLIGGRLRAQKFFEKLYRIGISGMYYGYGGNVITSGESALFRQLKNDPTFPKNALVFDVGANRGHYALEILNYLPGIQIQCFEPGKDTYAALLDNLKDSPDVVAHNLGFGRERGELTLFSNASGSELASLYQRRLEHHGLSLGKMETVKLDTIDQYCRDNSNARIDLLKIDVEGAELDVLMGAKHMLDQGNICFIQFEFGGCNIDARTYFQDFWYLLKDRYNIYRIVKYGLYHIVDYDETREIFMGINYLAIKK